MTRLEGQAKARPTIDRIARAVLYEGYVLYPYRASSLKNARPLQFGILYPQVWAESHGGSDRSSFRLECLLRGELRSELSVLVRFLQLIPPGNDAVEREVSLKFSVATAAAAPQRQSFSFPNNVAGEISAAVAAISPGLFKLSLIVQNTAAMDAPDRDLAMARSLASAHAAVTARGAQFVSLTDPPAEFAAAAASCMNVGVWPVLVGTAGDTDTILASPIILPDYPEVAPESAGDLCDSTEIDEILTLRILTLTDEEKAEVRNSGSHARDILERAETIPAEHMMRLHGTIRGLTASTPEPWSAWDSPAEAPLTALDCDGIRLRTGDRVRLRPGHRGDIFDSALQGRIAIITDIEQDLEEKIHVAVVLEDDPGRDLGEMRQIGHRFFFSASEIEPLGQSS